MPRMAQAGNAPPVRPSNLHHYWRQVMDTRLISPAKAGLAGACMLAAVLSQGAYAASPADSTQPVQSVWKPVEIKYSYVGFTTAYDCDSFESKVKNILLKLGAPPQTRVQANGCI